MKYVIGIVLTLLLGCGSSEGESATEMRSSGGGKADDVESSTDIQQMGSEDNMGGDEATEPESLADSFDYCGEFELYDDGDCHRFCHEPDPDCDGVPEEEDDFCAEFRESDGECSIPCGDVDPDCEEGPPQDSDWVPDEYTLRLCRDIDAGDRFLGLAETLCSEWIDNPTAYAQCIEACIAANEAE